MPRQAKTVVAMASAAVALLAVTVPAQANFLAEGTDPSGDAADASPGRDITRFAMVYAPKTGDLAGAIRFRGSPQDTPSFITLVATRRTASGCNGYPAGVFGSATSDFDAGWQRQDSAAGPVKVSGDADKRGSDTQVQRFETQARGLAGRRFDCAVAILTEQGVPSHVYDTAGPIKLVGQPALSVRVRGVPKTFVRNRVRRLKVTIANTGDGPARRVKLRLGRTRGLAVKPRARSLRTIAPGRRKTIGVDLRLGARARYESKLAVTATAGKLKASGKVPLRIKRPRPKRGGGTGGGGTGGGTPGSCVQYAPDLSGQSGGSLILVPCLH